MFEWNLLDNRSLLNFCEKQQFNHGKNTKSYLNIFLLKIEVN